MTWGMIGGAAISVVGGAILSHSNSSSSSGSAASCCGPLCITARDVSADAATARDQWGIESRRSH